MLFVHNCDTHFRQQTSKVVEFATVTMAVIVFTTNLISFLLKLVCKFKSTTLRYLS